MGVMSILVAQVALTSIALAIKSAPPTGVIATNLRGRSPEEKNDTQAPAEPAPRGHFYYSDSCGDCFYKEANCGCQPAMEYLACVTKHCSVENQTNYASKCGLLESQCSQEVDIQCHGAATTCKPKFNQLPSGGIGFILDRDGAEDQAFCGPFGKCIGKYEMKVNIRRPVPYQQAAAAAVAPAPAPVVAGSPAAVAPMAPVAPNVTGPVWLECGIGNSSFPAPRDFEKKEEWIICTVQVVGETAQCDLPMDEKRIKAEASKRSYCVLTDGSPGGKQLTQPAWVMLTNVHDDGKREPAVAPEPQVAANAKAEAPKSEPSAPKPEPAPKAEPAPKPAAKEAGGADDFGKPPWMENKDDKKPEAPPPAPKPPPPPKPKAAPKPAAKKTLRDGEPPWMENNSDKKPPPPM